MYELVVAPQKVIRQSLANVASDGLCPSTVIFVSLGISTNSNFEKKNKRKTEHETAFGGNHLSIVNAHYSPFDLISFFSSGKKCLQISPQRWTMIDQVKQEQVGLSLCYERIYQLYVVMAPGLGFLVEVEQQLA